jgi:copper(I)-binding protein
MKTAALAALTLALSVAAAQSAPAMGLEVLQPWSRPAVAGTTGAGYMVIANHGKAADVLTAVESPIAAKVEIHQMSMAGGVMSMARRDRIAIPAGGTVAFGPGGYHLMLLNLKRTLRAGDDAPATLVFASGARVGVRFKVGDGLGPPKTTTADSMAGMKH